MQHMSSTDDPESLGFGATALSCIFAASAGIVVGVITTFTHGQLSPWGLVAGLLIVAALVAGFRLVFGSRVVGAAAALGVVAASVVLTLPGAGGAALVLRGAVDWAWLLGPAILSTIVVASPRVRPRRGPVPRAD